MEKLNFFLRPGDDLLSMATFLRATLSILSDKRHLNTIDASSLTYRIKYACICVHPVRLFLNRISGHNTYLHPNNNDKIRMWFAHMPGGMNNPYNTILLSEVNIYNKHFPQWRPNPQNLCISNFSWGTIKTHKIRPPMLKKNCLTWTF